MDLKTDTWMEEVVESANRDDRFETATSQFDGSIALNIGDDVLWFKIYRGSIIDTESYLPQFGATFHIRGSREAWKQIRDGEKSLSEQLTLGNLRITGNKIEANRMRDAEELILRYINTEDE